MAVGALFREFDVAEIVLRLHGAAESQGKQDDPRNSLELTRNVVAWRLFE